MDKSEASYAHDVVVRSFCYLRLKLSSSLLSPSYHEQNINKVFDEMLMFVRVLWFLYILCTASSGLALTEVRGIANSKDSILMQGLVHRRQSVRGHPKARSEIGVMEHQNFLLGMERILGTVLAKSRNLASAFAGAEQGTSCSARRSSPKGTVVFETSNGKNVKRKVASTGQISKKDKS
ncbi:hypothetical protein BHE74_00014705 [Ensete ventricosum]|nr:hypothetical protein BHE74_00014705 [Ensete ventricosum]